MSEKKTYKLDLDEYYVRPQAAWEKMKAAQNIRQTVYIYGTTGTGKTSFVADFLARKRYCYIDMADTGMDELANIVQEKMENRSTFGKLIEELSGRKDVWLILISRAPVPKWLKSVFVRHIFVTIREEELCLTEKEQVTYLEKWELSPTEAACNRIRELGYGNPLFLRIVAMRLKDIPEVEAARDRMGAELRAIERICGITSKPMCMTSGMLSCRSFWKQYLL